MRIDEKIGNWDSDGPFSLFYSEYRPRSRYKSLPSTRKKRSYLYAMAAMYGLPFVAG